MMNEYTKSTLHELISGGFIGDDVEVLSDHNNLVVRNPSKRTVSRIAKIASMLSREDPGDLRYSHEASWVSADVAPVTRPVSRYAHESGGFIISTYPERQSIDWASHEARDVILAISRLSGSLEHVAEVMKLRTIDIPSYSKDRLDFADNSSSTLVRHSVDTIRNILEYHNSEYPFSELVEADKGLIHGDLHALNLMLDDDGGAEFIDMDSIAVGPKTYDMASWRVRHELGDIAPVDTMIDIRRKQGDWNEELFRALMGWKIVSSLTHIVRYERDPLELSNKTQRLGRIAFDLNALNITSAEVENL